MLTTTNLAKAKTTTNNRKFKGFVKNSVNASKTVGLLFLNN